MLQRCYWSPARYCRQSFWPALLRGYSSNAISLTPRPLRILFCGSDAFSASILHRLHQEHSKDKTFISSIDVVTRQSKPSGRGLKTFVQGPCHTSATKLGLRVHEIPTFTGWSPPPPVDLVLAVSFGLLVPPRILNGATYGGLNLHPSLLPDLWGPAPLHHTILQGRTSSGITLQTLHPKHFDRGKIIGSTKFDLPFGGRVTMDELRSLAASHGSDLLIQSLREGLYLPHHSAQLQPIAPDPEASGMTHAHKLTKEDARVVWNSWSSDRIVRTCRALGSLWSYGQIHRKGKTLTQRVRWSGIDYATSVSRQQKDHMQVGKMYGLPSLGSDHQQTVVKGSDGRVVVIERILPEGCNMDIPADAAARMIGREEL